jgi:hypothetical protein
MGAFAAAARRTGSVLRRGSGVAGRQLADLGDALATPRGDGPGATLDRILRQPPRHDGS